MPEKRRVARRKKPTASPVRSELDTTAENLGDRLADEATENLTRPKTVGVQNPVKNPVTGEGYGDGQPLMPVQEIPGLKSSYRPPKIKRGDGKKVLLQDDHDITVVLPAGSYRWLLEKVEWAAKSDYRSYHKALPHIAESAATALDALRSAGEKQYRPNSIDADHAAGYDDVSDDRSTVAVPRKLRKRPAKKTDEQTTATKRVVRKRSK